MSVILVTAATVPILIAVLGSLSGSVHMELFANKSNSEAYIKVGNMFYTSQSNGSYYLIVDYDTGK